MHRAPIITVAIHFGRICRKLQVQFVALITLLVAMITCLQLAEAAKSHKHQTGNNQVDNVRADNSKPVKKTAQSSADKEADLKQIRSRIESIRQGIESDINRRDALAGELETADSSIRSAREQNTEIRKQRQSAERRLAELNRERAGIEKQIAEQRSALAAEIRLAYMNGNEEQLKLLLNQQDPAELGRMLAYYGYFGRARAERIAAINEQLDHLKLIASNIEAETQHLRDIERQQQAQVTELAHARERRAQTLASIQSKLRSRSDELGALQKQAAALEHLIAELRSAVDDFPALNGQPFEKLKGKLPWPVKGKVSGHFGELRAGGPLKWEGILIEAAPGAQVRAPVSGRVVYADWLNGFGYLVVLDHGGGYLSLYGHNEQLYRRVGDMVSAGDVLSDLADRGGGKAELYMEIRKAKQQLDPQKWLHK